MKLVKAPPRQSLRAYLEGNRSSYRWLHCVSSAIRAIKQGWKITSPASERARRNILFALQRQLDQNEDTASRKKMASFYGVSVAELREWIDTATHRIRAAELRYSNLDAYFGAAARDIEQLERRRRGVDAIKRLRALRGAFQ